MAFRILDVRFRRAPRPARSGEKQHAAITWALNGGIPADDLASGDIAHIRNHVVGHDHTIPLDQVEGIARTILARYRLRPHIPEGVDPGAAGE